MVVVVFIHPGILYTDLSDLSKIIMEKIISVPQPYCRLGAEVANYGFGPQDNFCSTGSAKGTGG